MPDFEIVSPFAPRGDQPRAIEQLVGAFERGERSQCLLGVTGSGKTFTMAHVIARLNRPTLVLSHNKTLAAPLSCVIIRRMIQDFASAAARHLHDAHDLQRHEAWDNAAYLAGYVAECSVKAVIEQGGRAPRIHVTELSLDLLGLAADLGWAARRYRVDLDADLAAIRNAWQPDLRYCPTGTVDEARSMQIVSQAERVFWHTIGAMVLDGVYSQVPR